MWHKVRSFIVAIAASSVLCCCVVTEKTLPVLEQGAKEVGNVGDRLDELKKKKTVEP